MVDEPKAPAKSASAPAPTVKSDGLVVQPNPAPKPSPSDAAAQPSRTGRPPTAERTTPATPKVHGSADASKREQLIPSEGLPRDTKLTREQVEKISRAELAAIATDRGYALATAGVRVTREAFLQAQDKDENLKSGSAGSKIDSTAAAATSTAKI